MFDDYPPGVTDADVQPDEYDPVTGADLADHMED